MASQLSLYNDALLLCGERELASLTVNEEGRRLLDQVWNNGGVDYCLSQGLWYFARRTVQIDYDPAEDPQFGFQYAFSKPSDWVITDVVSIDEYLNFPLNQYEDENGYWYADNTPIYVRYISNDSAQYGGQIGAWPVQFKEYVAAYFASKIVHKISRDANRFKIVKDALKEAKHEAKQAGIMAQPITWLRPGLWNNSRRGDRSQRDRGNLNGPLIG